MGAKLRLHICGNITHLLPGIASLGIDVLDVDHMVDLRTVRNAVGPKVAIAGNLDPVTAVLRSTPDKIRAHVLSCYAQAGNPFMVNAGCEIPSATPEEILQALCEPVPFRVSQITPVLMPHLKENLTICCRGGCANRLSSR